jgi:predicted nucleotidyltransferase
MDNKLKIINHFGKNMGSSFTMHELSKLTGVPYATFYRTVKGMEELLVIATVGRAKTMRLNLQNGAIKSYLTISSEEEKREYLGAQPLIKKICSELDTKDIVVLFGSYAKGDYREDSDIDLLIINKSGEKSISFSKYEGIFKKRINPIFISQKEFRQMLREKEENVGKQALKHHILLNNLEQFWGGVLECQSLRSS